MKFSQVQATSLRTSPFDVSPLQQYRAKVQQEMLDGPPPSVVLKLSPFIGTEGPLKEMRARDSADVTYGRHPLGQEAPPVSRIETPAYSHGTYTAASFPDLKVNVSLGPLLSSHVDRAGGTPRALDVTA
ncbi:hypothetical protein [Mitsuaria sp. GD03876]|uniref:hypothetical protein n=1 Tax=Mitsuaria sp. GD03876 TaxID=2975399 RepID=UPI0024469E32|nr:hypothetical protein [Mitsuaria sp. GD03876]MDH0864901.1 hypothetical protein [Mitsuaria sp. GD03876]